MRWLTGNGKLVLRGGYARTYDSPYLLLGENIAASFPFVKRTFLPQRTADSFQALRSAAATPISDPNSQARTIAGGDLRSSIAEQFSLQLQRELRPDWALSVGYVGTKGTALIETVDGNPTVPGSGGHLRIDPARGVIQLRCNCASSIYHSLQASLEKRLAKDFSMAAHYTYSAFIDGASDMNNPTPNGEIGVAQDAFDRRADRARSSFDRPQRFTANGVYELPFHRAPKGAAGRLLGGWQVSAFLTLQSGAPFTALSGGDPGGRLTDLVPLAQVRANLNTSLDLANMSVEEMVRAGGKNLFSAVTATQQLGNLGRNILRSDGIGNLDLGLLKNTRIGESHNLQFRAEFYNTFNSRDFDIPFGTITSPNFLNQWSRSGGNRRIVLALRYTF